MRKTLKALTVSVITASLLAGPVASAMAQDYNGYNNRRAEQRYDERKAYRGWQREEYRRDERREERWRDARRDERREERRNERKDQKKAVIAGVAGLAIGALVVGAIANSNKNNNPPPASRRAIRTSPHDRMVEGPR